MAYPRVVQVSDIPCMPLWVSKIIFLAGITLYEIFSREQPFHEEVWQMIVLALHVASACTHLSKSICLILPQLFSILSWRPSRLQIVWFLGLLKSKSKFQNCWVICAFPNQFEGSMFSRFMHNCTVQQTSQEVWILAHKHNRRQACWNGQTYFAEGGW